MSIKFIIDKEKSQATSQEVPKFPWVRMDAGIFTWEEAFYEGNYLSVHHSAMGRCQSRERLYNKLKQYMDSGFPSNSAHCMRNSLHAFELEVNGQLLRNNWEWNDDYIRKTPEGYEELVVNISHGLAPVTVAIHTLLDGTSFITRWLEISNKGDSPCSISKLFPWCGIIAEDEGLSIAAPEHSTGFMLGTYNFSSWSMEGDFSWKALQEGTFKLDIQCRLFNPPMFIVRNQNTGEMTVIHFEWSGNLQAEFTNSYGTTFGRYSNPCKGNYLHAKIGLAGPAPHRVIYPGETVSSPRVHVSMLYGDVDACINSLYEHIRQSVKPKLPEVLKNLVEYNHTGYTENAQISAQLLIDEIDMAAEAGIELFMVDAGWFGPKESIWPEVVGDWYENPLLEGRLKDIFDHAREKGMKCGIWMEIERAGKASKLAQDHPGWFIVSGKKKLEMLDLSMPEVQEFIYCAIEDIVEKYNLDCYRIDHNYDQLTGGDCIRSGFLENTLWKYFEGLYSVFERLQQRFPNLLLENCSSGGGRTDLGMMKRFHWTQITDNWNPGDQIRILNGMTMGLPPEQCMCLVGAINMAPAEIDFVVRVGMFGHLCASGIFPTVDKSNEDGLRRWKHSIDLYKKEIRPILDECKVFHHTPVQSYRDKGNWVVLEYASKDANSSVIGIFRLLNSDSDIYKVIPKGLSISKKYSIKFDNLDESITLDGYKLLSEGITIRIPGPMMSELLIITEVN